MESIRKKLQDLLDKISGGVSTASSNLKGNLQALSKPETRSVWLKGFSPQLPKPVRQGVSNLKTNVNLLANPETADVWSAGFNASTIPGFLGQYLTNRYLEPVLQIPANVKKTVSPQSSLGERLFGGLGVMAGAATLLPDPLQDVAMPVADLLKGTSAYRIENKGKKVGLLEPIKKGGLPALSGEKYVGLGEALTSNTVGQTFGNIAELPLAMLTSKSLGKKASKETDELVRNVSRAVKEGNITLEEGMAILGKMGELPKAKVPKELEPLAEEARKYKNFEEFINKGITVDKKGNTYIGNVKVFSEKVLPKKSKQEAIRAIEHELRLGSHVPYGQQGYKNLADFYNQATQGTKEAPKVKIKAPETISPSGLGYKTEVPQKTILKISPEGKLQLPKKELPKSGVRMAGQPPIPEAPEGIGKGVPKTGAGGIPPSGEIISDQDLIKKLTQELKKAAPLRGKQEELYSMARSQKLAKMMRAREKMAGEKGFYEELGALKGELPKVQYEPVRQSFTQENVDKLFNMIKENKSLGEWEKINAQVGLQKILGEKGVGLPTKGELEKLNRVFGKEFTETLLSKRPVFEKMTDLGMQLYNLPRSMMAGVGDFSATLMQNLLFAYRHPVLTAKNFVSSVKMFANENFYKASMEEISQRPTYELMKKAKLSLTEVSPIVQSREEAFMAPIAEKIPGIGKVIGATGRAYTGFLNKMRADVFDQLVETQKGLGEAVDNPEFLKWAGKFVNAATGRGSLGQLERAAPILSQGFFSARKLAASVQMLDPRMYTTAPKTVRKEALKTMLSFLGGGLSILGLAKLAGAEVSTDSTSADFGKIKIGNTRFNVFGPYQQMAVLFSRLIKGYGTSSTTGRRFVLGEGYKPATRLDLLTRFFESKEHPTLSLIFGALRGQTATGEEFNLPAETIKRFIPMVLSDAYDLYKEHGPKGLLGVIPTALGIPAQTYGSYYTVAETTKSGKPTLKLKPETGMAEDIVNMITGKPKSNIPEPENKAITEKLWQEKLQKADYENLKYDLEHGKIPKNIQELSQSQDLKTQKLLFEYSGEKIKTIGDVIFYRDDEGNVKEADFSEVPLPKLTSNADYNKKLISGYKSKINKQQNAIIDLYELGYLDEETAVNMWLALEEKKGKVSGGKGKKLKVSAPPKINKIKIATTSGKTGKIKAIAVKPIKLTMPKAETSKPSRTRTEQLVKLIKQAGAY